MQAVHAGIVGRLFAGLDDLRLDFFARLGDDFLDATGMDASVGHELLERESRDFAPNGVEARHDHRVGRVVDDRRRQWRARTPECCAFAR